MISVALIIPFIIILIYVVLRRVYRRSEVDAFARGDGELIDGDFFKTIRCTKKVLRLEITFFVALFVYALIMGGFCIARDYSSWAIILIIVSILLVVQIRRVCASYVKYSDTVEELCNSEYEGDKDVYRSEIR